MSSDREAGSAARNRELAEDLRQIAESIVDIRTDEGKRLLAAHGNERIQDGVVLLDSIQARLGELERGDRSARE